jgi:ATP-dependent protease HslVU (ClpYQ) peptidase subunit
MTTLAYRNGILAADSQLTVGDVKMISTNKILILNNETILSAAGLDEDIAKASIFFTNPDFDRLIGTDKTPLIKREFEAFLFFRGLMYTMDKALIPCIMTCDFYALGSGWQLAYAAMAMGKSAIEAVRFAGKLDIYTNQEIRWIDVEKFSQGKGKITKSRSIKQEDKETLEEIQAGDNTGV